MSRQARAVRRLRSRPSPVPRAVRRLASSAIAICALLGPSYLFVQHTLQPVSRQRVPPPVTLSPRLVGEARRVSDFSGAVPALSFHDVSHRRGRYTVTPQVFARHMAALAEAGFETVTLADVRALVTGGAPRLPARPLLITFDDGPASNWLVADPILAQHGFSAVAFVVTGSVADDDGSYYLSWDQIDDMRRSGRWEIGAHTHRGHRTVDVRQGPRRPWLTHLKHRDGARESVRAWHGRVARDLARSRALLRTRIGRQPTSAFAYPFGATGAASNHPRLEEMLRRTVASRFDVAFAGQGRPAMAATVNSDPMRVPRLSVRRNTSSRQLLRLIGRAVDRSPLRRPDRA